VLVFITSIFIVSVERLRHSTSAICGKIGENKDTVSQVD
jgi:hypothetical protein